MDYKEVITIDPKVASSQFLQLNSPALHHAKTIREVLENDTFVCLMHSGKGRQQEVRCRLDDMGHQPTLMVIGFPCSPYSSQRPGRFGTGSGGPWSLQQLTVSTKHPFPPAAAQKTESVLVERGWSLLITCPKIELLRRSSSLLRVWFSGFSFANTHRLHTWKVPAQVLLSG